MDSFSLVHMLIVVGVLALIVFVGFRASRKPASQTPGANLREPPPLPAGLNLGLITLEAGASQNAVAKNVLNDLRRGDVKAVSGGIWCKSLPAGGNDQYDYIDWALIGLASDDDRMKFKIGLYKVTAADGGSLVRVG